MGTRGKTPKFKQEQSQELKLIHAQPIMKIPFPIQWAQFGPMGPIWGPRKIPLKAPTKDIQKTSATVLARKACLVPLAVSSAFLSALKLLGVTRRHPFLHPLFEPHFTPNWDPQNHQKSQKTSPKDPHGSNRAKSHENSSAWDPLHMPKLHEGSQKSLFAGMWKNTTNKWTSKSTYFGGFQAPKLKKYISCGVPKNQQKNHMQKRLIWGDAFAG